MNAFPVGHNTVKGGAFLANPASCRGRPFSARTGPRHLQSVCSAPPTPQGTHTAHTKFLQTLPRANCDPKCTLTVQRWKQACRWQRKHGSYSPESYSGGWARAAPDCRALCFRGPHPGGLAGSWPQVQQEGSTQWMHVMQTPCQDTRLLPGATRPQKEASIFPWLSFFPTLTFSLQTAWAETQGKQRVGAGASPFPIRNRGKQMTWFSFSQHLYSIYKVDQWGLKFMVPRKC